MKRKTFEIALSDMHLKQQQYKEKFANHTNYQVLYLLASYCQNKTLKYAFTATSLQSLASKNILKACRADD